MSRPADSTRDHALDGVRAAAMLLGVVYHSIQFRMFVGGMPPGPMGGPGGADRWAQEWLHSFRMPLFFLISGFFGRMTLEKSGAGGYLRKRWTRIGIPLLIGMFTFSPLYVIALEQTSSGPGPGMARPAGPPQGGPTSPGDLPPPPPGFVPPPLVRFDVDGDGSLSPGEWAKAREQIARDFGPGGPGGGGGPRGPMMGPFGGRGGSVSDRLFGPWARYFQLNHLWFLWYLLAFATVAPPTTRLLGFVTRPMAAAADRLGSRLIRLGLAPLALGLIAAPALMLTSGPFGWGLGVPATIFRAFPDFLLKLDVDMLFYFIVFLFGWWVHRGRESLPSLARAWMPNLILGVVAFYVATRLGDAYGRRPRESSYPLIRGAAYTLYSFGSASCAFAFLGFFRRYLDRPTPAGRYLADTAFWVYLIHQPIVLVGLAWLMPYGLPWWAVSGAVALLAFAGSLFLYEAIVRPTPLVRLFGPAGARRPATESGTSDSAPR